MYDQHDRLPQVLRQKRRPRVCRILWAIVVTALFVMTIYMVYSLLRAYFKYDSYNQSSTLWKDNVTLPALTICSSNYINYTSMREAMEREDQMEVLEAFDQVMGLLERYDGVGNILELFDANKEAFKKVVKYEVESGSLQMKFSLDVKTLVTGTPHYFFESIGRNVTDVKESINPTELGMCLDINEDGLLQQSIGGTRGGFSINLNTNLRDYLPTTSSHGLVIFIRDQDENVMMNQGGYIISPGTETFVKLKAKSAKRLGPPHGTCKNVQNIYSKRNAKFESIRECLQRQAVEAMIHKCACIPIYFAGKMWLQNKTHILDEFIEIIKPMRAQEYYQSYYDGTTETVNKTFFKESVPSTTEDNMTSETDQMKKLFINSSFYKYTCALVHERACSVLVNNMIRKRTIKFERCPEPCQYNEWEAVVTSSAFPSTRQYFNMFLRSVEMPTYEHAKDNIARLHVYYDDIRVQDTQQKPAYQPHNLLAEFGGTVDLFIGFSFFTVLQLIEIMIAACVLKCRGRKEEEKV